jgi:hypothetical protein
MLVRYEAVVALEVAVVCEVQPYFDGRWSGDVRRRGKRIG